MQANWLINVFVFRAHCCNSDGVSKENLHFDNQVVFLFLVPVFSKRNRKHVLCVSIKF